MSDCRFGVSPVNYPDPDPVTYISWSSDFALYLQDYLMDADHT